MAFADVLAHSGQRKRTLRSGAWVEGSRKQVVEGDGVVPPGPTFACVVFLPKGGEESRSGRQVKRPTLLYEPYDVAEVEFELAKDDLVVVTAADEEAVVRGLIEGTWQVEGDPQPFGRPGEPVVGLQATIRRVEG